jgi:GH24 family phage-related lysozyme (muramidase)
VIEVPQAAIDLAMRFEGFHQVPKVDPGRTYPYICPAGYWTIGYGRLCDPQHPPITEAYAEAYLAHDLMTALAAAFRCYCPVLASEPEGRLAAIVDFTSISVPDGFSHRRYGGGSASGLADRWKRNSSAGYMARNGASRFGCQT